jgi:hypothetical protein
MILLFRESCVLFGLVFDIMCDEVYLSSITARDKLAGGMWT